MGTRGPAPKREAQRRRTNKPEVPVDVAEAGDAGRPPANEKWHPIALGWYESLAVSGQAVFYESADWHTAYAMSEAMSREFKPQFVGMGEDEEGKPKPIIMEIAPRAAFLNAWLKACAVLLATEGDRRRLRLELTRKGAEEAVPDDVSQLDEYRRRIQSG